MSDKGIEETSGESNVGFFLILGLLLFTLIVISMWYQYGFDWNSTSLDLNFSSENFMAENAAVNTEFLNPVIGENWWMSTRHPESLAIAQTITSLSQKNYDLRLHRVGNCETPGATWSNGTVCIYAGVEGQIIHFAILAVFSRQMAFVVISAPLQTQSVPGLSRIAEGIFYNPKQLYWNCAWWMAFKTVNGHGAQPQLMTVGQGFEKWLLVKTRYNLVIPVIMVEVPNIW